MPPEGRLALLKRIEELEDRLQEAEDTLRAIRSGEVDAVVATGPEGDRVYTLRGADEAYRILVQGMSEGAVTLSLDGLILFCNEQFASMVALPAARVVGSRIQEFIAPDDTALLTALLTGRGPSKGEVRLKRGDAALVPAYLSAVTVALDGVECVCLIATDLTDQKRNEEIISAERLARSILDQAASAILVVDSRGRIVRASRVAEELSGAPVLLRELDDVFPLRAGTEGDAPTFARILARLWRDGNISGLEATAQMPDGRSIHLLVNAALLHGAQSQALGCIVSLSDVTELRRMVAELRQNDEERERQARVKDEFLALLGHELRNPLAAISTAMQLLAGGVPAERRVSLDQMMGRQVAVLRRLVDDLLDLARITHGQIDMQRERIDLAELLQKAAAAARSPIVSRGQELVVRLPAERVQFMADGVRMEQIVANLLNNAAKYTGRGGRIEFSGAREESEVVIRCKDSGRGIPLDMQKMIFEPFTRVRVAGEKATEGVGIGLALVKRLVELHGGTVSAESGGPGAGSEFVVRLPLVEPPPSRPRRKETERRPSVRGALSIVVVEDSPDVAQTLAIALEQAGHRVTLFEDGPSAVSGLAGLKPSAVVVDIGLPGMDGYELAASLRKMPDLEHTLFVGLSGFKKREQTGEAHVDFDYYFLKPVELPKLLSVLDKHARAPTPAGP